MTIDNLFLKIKDHDLETFPFALEEYLKVPGNTVNDKDSLGNLLLGEAVTYNCLPIIQLLLEKKANIDAFNKIGVNALMLATQEHHIDIMTLLLQNNANPNIKNKMNRTVLSYSLTKSQTDPLNTIRVIQLLLDYKANINTYPIFGVCDDLECSILDVCVLLDQAPIAEYLILKGATFYASLFECIQEHYTLTESALYTILEETGRIISITNRPYGSSMLSANKIFQLNNHNTKIKNKFREIAFQLGLQTPLLDKLSNIISQFLSCEPELTQTLSEGFMKGQALRCSPPPVTTHISHEELETRTPNTPTKTSLKKNK